MSGIFISYRREDAAPWAGRVYERLTKQFEPDHIFMDVDNIAPGLDFVEELERHVGVCDALLAIIGRGWVDARNSKGDRRLDDPHDFVRIELEAALQRGVRVIPVLVDGATMPSTVELPESLQRLARRNAIELTHNRFGSDAQRLVGVLQSIADSSLLSRVRNAEAMDIVKQRDVTDPAVVQAMSLGAVAKDVRDAEIENATPISTNGSNKAHTPHLNRLGVTALGVTALVFGVLTFWMSLTILDGSGGVRAGKLVAFTTLATFVLGSMWLILSERINRLAD